VRQYTDIEQAERVAYELRTSAESLIVRSRELAEEGERLKQRADDLTELIKRHNSRSSKAGAGGHDAKERPE